MAYFTHAITDLVKSPYDVKIHITAAYLVNRWRGRWPHFHYRCHFPNLGNDLQSNFFHQIIKQLIN